MTRLVFHIGDRKTGTSSLQYVLDAWDRSDTAPEHDVLHYPRAGRMGSGQRVNHTNLAHALFYPDRFSREDGGWADLGDEVAANPGKTLLVSSEGFESVEPARMAEMIRTCIPGDTEIRILVYLRPHIDRILASYTQNLKTGKISQPLEKFVRQSARGRLGQPYRRVSAWKNVFEDRLTVRPYIRDRLLNRSIIDDILVGELGLETSFVAGLPLPRDENTTPGALSLAVIQALLAEARQIKGMPPSRLEMRVLRPFRKRLAMLYPEDRKFVLTRPFVEVIHEACHEDAEFLDKAFFADDPVMKPAIDAGRAAAPPEETFPGLPDRDAQLHEIYRLMIAELLSMSGQEMKAQG